ESEIVVKGLLRSQLQFQTLCSLKYQIHRSERGVWAAGSGGTTLTENKRLLILLLSAATSFVRAETPAAKAPDAAGAEFFESRIRPVLAKNCYGCHAGESGSPMGGLFLNSRKGMLTGGKSGPAIVPGKPDESLLIHAIKYEGRKMPPSGQLNDAV